MAELQQGQAGLRKSTGTCLKMTKVKGRLDWRVAERLRWKMTDMLAVNRNVQEHGLSG